MTDPDTRRRELAQIHIAKKQLGLDEETYRAMLRTIGRVESSAHLGDHGRKALLEHLKARGFVAKKPHARRANPEWAWVNNAAPDRQALLRKIAVMLNGADRSKPYADAMALQMFKADRIEFCTPDQLRRIVSALVFDQRRREGAARA